MLKTRLLLRCTLWLASYLEVACGTPQKYAGMYSSPSPGLQILSVTPNRGPTTGITLLDVHGTGFTPDIEVYIAGKKAERGPGAISSSDMSIMLPANLGQLGPVPVELRLPSGETTERMDLFKYYAGQSNFGNLGAPFQTSSDYAAVVTALAVVDVNADNIKDLVVANQGQAGTVGVLLGLGNSSFLGLSTASNYEITVGTAPRAIAAGDWNGDGKIDLAVANYGDDNLSILTGTGTGLFSQSGTAAVGTRPRGMVQGDWNRDGKLDLAVANEGSDNLSILIGNGDGSFSATMPIVVGTAPRSIALGDWDLDGKVDLAVANSGSNDVTVLLGQGDGRFTAASTLPVRQTPIGIASADMDRDGDADLLVENAASGEISIMLGRTGSTFTSAVHWPVASNPVTLAVADLNHDEVPDVIVSDSATNRIIARLGQGDGTLAPDTPLPLLETDAVPYTLAVSDLDANGKVDLIIGNLRSPQVSVFVGPLLSLIPARASYAVGSWPTAIASGNLNDDGKPDLAIVNTEDDSVSLLMNQDGALFTSAPILKAGRQPVAVVMADVNADNRADIVVANLGSDSLSTFLNQGGGQFAAGTSTAVGQRPCSLYAADLNGDKAMDIVAVNSGSNTASILLSQGGRLQLAQTLAAGQSPQAAIVKDFNLDKQADLAIVSSITGEVQIWQNQGAGNLVLLETHSLGGPLGVLSSKGIAAADLDGDGAPDLAITNQRTERISVLWNSGNGKFGPVKNFEVLYYNSERNLGELATGDFNGDGQEDLAVVAQTLRAVVAMTVTAPRLLIPCAYISLNEMPLGLSAVDLNGDKLSDLITTFPERNTVRVQLNLSR